jgi:hypothetical protein
VPLIAGRFAVAVDPDIAAPAAGRCDLQPFERSSPPAAPGVRLRRGDGAAPPEAIALGGGGGYLVNGPELRVWISGDPWSAEAAVRAAFAVAFERQGGLLLHAAGIAFPGAGAWLAVGPSGCGKSTLSQRCADAGAEILSDETVGWLPDGTLWPTPFRSSAHFTRGPGPPAGWPLSVLAFLEHGEAERLEPLPPAEAVKQLLPQAYRTPGASALHRVAALVDQRGARRFRFRNDPRAAAFVKAAGAAGPTGGAAGADRP